MTTTDAISRAKALFKSKFGTDAEVGGTAPGRVNLIGEHTDYCDGFVFPLALQFSTVVLGRKNPAHADTVVVCSEARDQETAEFPISDGMKAGEPAWTNYMRGMVSIYRENGFDVPGFDAVVCTDVPIGGGVSSSAAFEVG
uniref:Galactokinase N-terminal domain-containing protein n=1 Tax=Rhodosorus marinus TaxID=101924 RepID=A0A7S0BRR6_9RHOD|mmetsp:Transcript_4654/g.6433  ORF Transcript_4654/g.6433 Transcript_4654/m.6433 type:complete len:141 (+) Transcript_4654:69-491(+)